METNRRVHDLIHRAEVSGNSLVCPVFVTRNRGVGGPISSVPGICRCSLSETSRVLGRVRGDNVTKLLVFKVPGRGSRLTASTCSSGNMARGTVECVGGGCPSLLVVTSIYLYRCADRNRYNIIYNRRVLGSRALPLLSGVTIDLTGTNTSVVTPSSVVSNEISTVEGTLSRGKLVGAPVVSCDTGFTSNCCSPFHSTTRSTPRFNSEGDCRVSCTGNGRTLHRVTSSVSRNTSVIVIGPTLTCLSVMGTTDRHFSLPLITCGMDNRCTVIGTTTRGN